MRAVVVTRHGGPEVLALQDLPAPAAGPDELLVDVAFAGVNFRDVYEREGFRKSVPPLVTGAEGSGTVVRTGERVAWGWGLHSYAEQIALPTKQAVPIPDGISDEVAAALMLQGLTAHCLCYDAYPVRAGDTVVVHAAAGGVGLLLTQLATLRGARVIGTTSSEAKAELAREAGADEVIPYEGFAEHVLELTDGEGAAAVFDGVGAATVDAGFGCLRLRGTLVAYGWASGVAPPIDLRKLEPKSLYVTRPGMDAYTATRAELLERANDLFGFVADGRLRVRIDRIYPLAEAGKAQADLESRRTSGKLLLSVRD